ncbi:MAG: sporulation protein YqfD [Oscillibacter sp.]|jgi:similar to stage IV sporulation protein|uniref:sporulation protein YqfD n=1 Tax=uncultured Oscillibacter sp. TaxID=876091 RepID=UPI00216DEAE1|nr:sporulation protein YqfD [uncultured Oscillibacter sp.]MCI9644887.1 sporulation protein YqfD [Oscillibacter sp.]
MLTRLINHLRGQVRVRAECAFPERVLNLCGAQDLAFWDLEWESPTAFTCRLSRRDWRALREAGKKLDCTFDLVGREGAPYFLFRFRHRQALLVGLVGCALALFLGSFFIWDFQVEGNVTVPTERILRALEKNGVTLGTFGLSLDGEDIRNHVLLDVPELIWIAVNVSGCRAEVQVRERTPPPVMVDRREPCNLVARRAGLVKNVQTIGGVACVVPGSAVTEGQILISGVEDTDTVGARVLAGLGKVEARTWYDFTASMPLTVLEKRYTGKEKTGVSLIFGSRRIKFFSNSSIDGTEYDKITSRHPLNLLGVPLPVTVVTETWRFYEAVPRARTAAEAEKAAEALLTAQLREQVEPYGEVKSTLCSSRQRGNTLVVTLSAECLEEIGKTAPIYTEEETG